MGQLEIPHYRLDFIQVLHIVPKDELQRDNQQPATERPAWGAAQELCPYPLHRFYLAQDLGSPRSLPWDTQRPSTKVSSAPMVTDAAQRGEGTDEELPGRRRRWWCIPQLEKQQEAHWVMQASQILNICFPS